MPKQKRHKQPKLRIIVDLPNDSNRAWYDEKYRRIPHTVGAKHTTR